MLPQKYVVNFKDVGKEDINLVGGKGANLGEMTQAGFPVPQGFIITATAYFDFIKENNLQTKISHILGTVDYTDQASLDNASEIIKKLIREGELSEILVKAIFKAYSHMSGVFKDALVAVRSSATSEDLSDASFAGQQETYLNVKGEATLLARVKDVYASLFDARAIFYRHEQKYDHFKTGIAVPIQKMVESDTSGIMFTLDPVTNDKSKIVIEAIFGLGELIVQGAVTPDHYEVTKIDGKILLKKLAYQTAMLVKKGIDNKEIPLTQKEGTKQKISDKQILQLAELGKKLEQHYYFPQDSEWAIEKGDIFLVQTRPVTTINEHITKKASVVTPEAEKKYLILKGDPASPGIASGPVKIIANAKELHKIKPGDILVAPQTNPDFVSAMKKAAAIITEQGGRTSHAAIVSRELGIPAVVGTQHAMHTLIDGTIITVNGATGEIYKGGSFSLQQNQEMQMRDSTIQTATKVYVNLAEPQLAENIAKRHVDGIGLLRAEFMMADIGTHPKQMIKEGKRQVYIEKLAQDLATFCKAFSPRPVVYRTSDFKTNEYRHLRGGEAYEPHEANPMLGFRGAFRYLHDPELFEMELDAIKLVRNNMGLKNLWIMLPFVRTVEELVAVKKLIVEAGLYRSSSFKIWMMVEIPANVILLDKFIEAGIDGISIGSNDLTMLTLGLDRDNTEVAQEFDEENEAMLWSLERVIKTAHKYNVTSSLCGQAILSHPLLLEKLVQWGITSVSVSPDALSQTREHIAAIEQKLVEK